jgi:AmpD protein
MHIDTQNGLLREAKYSHSPNFDERPADCQLDLLVIHGISLPPGEYGSDDVKALFTNTLDASKHPYFETLADVKVSCHLFIRRDGEVLQFVPFHKRAWHAGASCFEGRENCNHFSIGIELEGTDTDAYTAVQYTQLAEVTRAIVEAYPAIKPSRIVGHSDIAPSRKTDPGEGFDWEHYRSLINNILVDQQNDQRAGIIT